MPELTATEAENIAANVMKSKPNLTEDDVVLCLKYGLGPRTYHALGDYYRREMNAREVGEDGLCPVCDGTGNRLLSMYQQCKACSGTGRCLSDEVFRQAFQELDNA